MTDCTIVFGDDSERVEHWMKLNQLAQRGCRPDAHKASTFWSFVQAGPVTCPTCGGDGDCIDCDLIVVGARVTALLYGAGIVTQVTNEDVQNIFVKLDTPARSGSELWFSRVELTPMEPPPGDDEPGIGPPTEGDEAPEWHLPCVGCHTRDYVPSAIVPDLCIGCSNARFYGFHSRLEAERFRLPSPVMYCASCLNIATQVGADAWRCTGCAGVGSLDELLTTSELLRRRAALGRIKVVVMERMTCKNCGALHQTQKCPEIRAALLAVEATPCVYDTLEMMRLWAISRTLLTAKLSKLSRPQLLAQAVAFAAWLEERTRSGLSAASVLHIWEQMIANGGDGPAAPALRVAA